MLEHGENGRAEQSACACEGAAHAKVHVWQPCNSRVTPDVSVGTRLQVYSLLGLYY